MAYLSEIPGDRILPLGEATLLGRDPACDIVVPSGGASRRHARVVATADGFTIEDPPGHADGGEQRNEGDERSQEPLSPPAHPGRVHGRSPVCVLTPRGV